MVLIPFWSSRDVVVPQWSTSAPTCRERDTPHKAIVGRVVTVAWMAVTALAGAAPTPAGAAPARLTGHTTSNAVSGFNSIGLKTATAVCPAGKVVLGGGGEIRAADIFVRLNVTLTQMEPFRTGSGRYAYNVTAAETSQGTPGDWALSAQAICADPVPGYSIEHMQTAYSSSPVKAISPVCPSGKRVLGTGARVNWPLDIELPGVGLQVVRADALGGLTRAQAHEQAAGVSHDWQLLGFVVCGEAPQGYEIRGAESELRDSETMKFAGVDCTGTKKLINSGAGISNVAPGNVTLNTVRGFSYLNLIGGRLGFTWRAYAYAYENTPTSIDWDFIVSQAICVD